jgi:hypothetical protein
MHGPSTRWTATTVALGFAGAGFGTSTLGMAAGALGLATEDGAAFGGAGFLRAAGGAATGLGSLARDNRFSAGALAPAATAAKTTMISNKKTTATKSTEPLRDHFRHLSPRIARGTRSATERPSDMYYGTPRRHPAGWLRSRLGRAPPRVAPAVGVRCASA